MKQVDIFFCLYLDPLLLTLNKSQTGCHINHVYMGALSYADDITIICQSIRSLNNLVKICNEFAQSNTIIFSRTVQNDLLYILVMNTSVQKSNFLTANVFSGQILQVT